MNIGENIRKFRKALGLTQAELSEKIGKSERMVQKYETDEVVPSPSKNLEIIAQASEVTVAELMGCEAELNTETVIQGTFDISKITTDDLMKELFRRFQ